MADPNDHFPPVPTDLLEALERLFPDRLPDLRISDRDLGAAIGANNVVRFLRDMHERQRNPNKDL